MLLDSNLLSRFYPFDKLRPECLDELVKDASLEEVGKGTVLFQAQDTDDKTIYLINGVVRGDYPDGKVKTTDGSSLQGRYALGDLQPRRFTTTVISLTAQLVKLDRRYAEKVVIWDQLSRSEGFKHYDSDPSSNRWIFRILNNRALHRLPASAVERFFQRLEEVSVVKDQLIVRAGDQADYFYVIKEGSASVSKPGSAAEEPIAYLLRGDSFGEDALLTKGVRNANIRMLSDGKLMRLSNRDFAEILMPPVVDWVNASQAISLLRKGAQLLDVRSQEEYEESAIPGALNIPLINLRDRMDELDRSRKIVVHCTTGERAAAAVFILNKVGFNALALKGGLNAMLKQLETR